MKMSTSHKPLRIVQKYFNVKTIFESTEIVSEFGINMFMKKIVGKSFFTSVLTVLVISSSSLIKAIYLEFNTCHEISFVFHIKHFWLPPFMLVNLTNRIRRFIRSY